MPGEENIQELLHDCVCCLTCAPYSTKHTAFNCMPPLTPTATPQAQFVQPNKLSIKLPACILSLWLTPMVHTLVPSQFTIHLKPTIRLSAV